ncbi:MAG: hypothetical protein WCF00_12800, partial [Azonexus sp.]
FIASLEKISGLSPKTKYENQDRGADKPEYGAGTKHCLEIPNFRVWGTDSIMQSLFWPFSGLFRG